MRITEFTQPYIPMTGCAVMFVGQTGAGRAPP